MKPDAPVPKVIPLTLIPDERGSIGVVECGTHVHFAIERFYFITDTPEGTERGGHGHKRLWQAIIALRGKVTIELTDGRSTCRFDLASYDQGLIVPPGWWRELRDFGSDTLLGVLASRVYEEDDYIRDFSEFVDWKGHGSEIRSVPYLPLQRQTADSLGASVSQAVQRVVQSGYYIGGPEVTGFEKDFASFCSAKEAIGVANGLEALQLALLAEGIGPGDDVIIPAHTFVATALAVTNVGAQPRLVDVEADTGLLDPALVADAIRSTTRAIIPVHLYGHPVDMDPILRVARNRSLFVLEDAAQAHGATYNGRQCGSLGDAAAFSFYPTKNLGAMGDAGAVTTDDAARSSKIRKLANYGSSTRYTHELVGMNSRLDPIQAAILARKLPHLAQWNERRRFLANIYLDKLAGLSDLKLPGVRPWAVPVWHVFPVCVTGGRRDELASCLNEHGIGTNIHYPVPIHKQPCFRNEKWIVGSFPNAERYGREVLSLPLDPYHSDEEIRLVVKTVVAFFRKHY